MWYKFLMVLSLFFTACGTGSGRESTPSEIKESNRLISESETNNTNALEEEKDAEDEIETTEIQENHTLIDEKKELLEDLNESMTSERNGSDLNGSKIVEYNLTEEENITLPIDKNYSDEELTFIAYEE